jgi:hypothetical protein
MLGAPFDMSNALSERSESKGQHNDSFADLSSAAQRLP